MQRAPADQDDNLFEDIRPSKIRRVIAPVVIVFLLLVALVVLVLLSFSPIGLQEPGQVSIISNIFLICFALCPLVICAVPLYFVVIMSIYGVNLAEKSGRKSLRGLRSNTRSMADRTDTATEKLNRRSIKWGTRLTYLGEFFAQSDDDEKSNDEPSNKK